MSTELNLYCVLMPVGYNKGHIAQQGPECHDGASTGLITKKNTACDIFLLFWQGMSVSCFALLMHRLLPALNYWEPLQLSFHSQQHSFIPHLVAGISPLGPLLDERIQLQDQLTLTLSWSNTEYRFFSHLRQFLTLCWPFCYTCIRYWVSPLK